MVKCNQVCPWNYYEIGCKKPDDELCPMSKLATKDKQKTNADKVRNMNDDELAKFMAEKPLCPKPKEECAFNCSKCWIEWLKQPAE